MSAEEVTMTVGVRDLPGEKELATLLKGVTKFTKYLKMIRGSLRISLYLDVLL